MTTKTSILILFILTTSRIFCQTSNTESLTGTWYLSNSYPETNDSLVYSRTSDNSYNWGDRIEIYSNHNFTDAYSAKCGNDERIHNDTGTWTLESNLTILITSIPISYDHKTKHKILRHTINKLILKKID